MVSFKTAAISVAATAGLLQMAPAPQAIVAAIVGGVVGGAIPAGAIMCSRYCPGPKRHMMRIMSRDLPPGVSQESVDQCTGQINDQTATGVTVTLTDVDEGSK